MPLLLFNFVLLRSVIFHRGWFFLNFSSVFSRLLISRESLPRKSRKTKRRKKKKKLNLLSLLFLLFLLFSPEFCERSSQLILRSSLRIHRTLWAASRSEVNENRSSRYFHSNTPLISSFSRQAKHIITIPKKKN